MMNHLQSKLTLDTSISQEFTETNGIPRLIGIFGHAGAGKDTITEFLYKNYHAIYAEAFASPVKDIAASAFNIARELFDSPSIKNEVLPNLNASPRELAQYVGTEMFRNLHPDFWVWKLSQRIQDPEVNYLGTDTIVISDCRFQNEIDFITKHGGIIIHLSRPGVTGNVGIPGHASEAHSTINFPGGKTYVIVNDGTINQLYKKVATLFVDLLIPDSSSS
jgi:hypothetical protein